METIHEFFQERSESAKCNCMESEKYAVCSSSSVILGKKLSDGLLLNETYINIDTLKEKQMDIQPLRNIVLDHISK